MRKGLAAQDGLRKKFSAKVSRFGRKANYHGYSEETILLKHVVDLETGKVVTDHQWFSFTKGFQDAQVREGVMIEFEARVKSYNKGYVNRRYGIDQRTSDYKLSHPTKITVTESR